MTPRYQSLNLTEKTVHAMLGTLIVLALVYCIVLLSLVFSVIEQKQNIIATKDLTSRLSMFEAAYANKVASINDATLAENHFKRVDNTTFAVRKDPIASYTVLYAH